MSSKLLSQPVLQLSVSMRINMHCSVWQALPDKHCSVLQTLPAIGINMHCSVLQALPDMHCSVLQALPAMHCNKPVQIVMCMCGEDICKVPLRLEKYPYTAFSFSFLLNTLSFIVQILICVCI